MRAILIVILFVFHFTSFTKDIGFKRLKIDAGYGPAFYSISYQKSDNKEYVNHTGIGPGCGQLQEGQTFAGINCVPGYNENYLYLGEITNNDNYLLGNNPAGNLTFILFKKGNHAIKSKASMNYVMRINKILIPKTNAKGEIIEEESISQRWFENNLIYSLSVLYGFKKKLFTDDFNWSVEIGPGAVIYDSYHIFEVKSGSVDIFGYGYLLGLLASIEYMVSNSISIFLGLGHNYGRINDVKVDGTTNDDYKITLNKTGLALGFAFYFL